MLRANIYSEPLYPKICRLSNPYSKSLRSFLLAMFYIYKKELRTVNYVT